MTIPASSSVDTDTFYQDYVQVHVWQLPSSRWVWELHWKDGSLVSTDAHWLVEGETERYEGEASTEAGAVEAARGVLRQADRRREKRVQAERIYQETFKVYSGRAGREPE